MSSKSVNPVEKKLLMVRRILLFLFCPISLVVLGWLVMAYIGMINSPFIAELIIPTVFLLTAIGVYGVICLGIYHLVKNHLEKDEGPFL
jgi:membrane protein YdbS with pleckstrin-like domain